MKQNIKEIFKYCFTGPIHIYPLLGLICGVLFYYFCFDTMRTLVNNPTTNAILWSVIVGLLIGFISLFATIWVAFTDELVEESIIDEKWQKRVRNTGIFIYYLAATLCLMCFELKRSDNLISIIILLYGAIGYAWLELYLKLKRIESQ